MNSMWCLEHIHPFPLGKKEPEAGLFSVAQEDEDMLGKAQKQVSSDML